MINYPEEIKNNVVAYRRHIHGLAELGGVEFQTRDYVLALADKLGLPHDMVTDVAFIVTLDTGKPGPGIALRADMDALPLHENPENLKGPRVCLSQHDNTCHACGHDAHTAMLMGAMEALCGMKDRLTGVLYFCFESGEENGASGAQMVEALTKRRVDTVWGIHVYSKLETGKMGVSLGPCMAGAVIVDMTFHGKGGHGSRPDLSISPVYAAAELVTTLPGVFVNQLNVEKTVTYGMTSIQAGEAFNVFPETARVRGSLRYFDVNEGRKAQALVKKTAEHVAAIHNCTVDFVPTIESIAIPVVNDKAYAERAREVARELYGAEAAPDEFPLWYASESFSAYCQAFPGVFVLLGITDPEAGSGAEHHNERFDIDEKALDIGVKTTINYVMSLIEKGLPR